MKQIQSDYRKIVGVNTILILLEVGSVIQPTTSAMYHNVSTLAISMQSMRELWGLLQKEQKKEEKTV